MPDSSKCREIKTFIAGRLDGELSAEENRLLDRHLAECSACRDELTEMKLTGEVMSTMNFNEPEDRIWQGYWAGVYNRLERGFGWILFSFGLILVLIYSLFQLMGDFLHDSSLPLYFRLGVTALTAGIVVLLVSVGRERLKAYKSDRYREVKR